MRHLRIDPQLFDEVVLDDAGNRMFVCSDTDIAANRARQKTNESTVTFGQYLTHLYAPGKGFSDVSFDLWRGKCWASSGNPAPGRPRC